MKSHAARTAREVSNDETIDYLFRELSDATKLALQRELEDKHLSAVTADGSWTLRSESGTETTTGKRRLYRYRLQNYTVERLGRRESKSQDRLEVTPRLTVPKRGIVLPLGRHRSGTATTHFRPLDADA